MFIKITYLRLDKPVVGMFNTKHIIRIIPHFTYPDYYLMSIHDPYLSIKDDNYFKLSTEEANRVMSLLENTPTNAVNKVSQLIKW